MYWATTAVLVALLTTRVSRRWIGLVPRVEAPHPG
jgi:hypothetical protein